MGHSRRSIWTNSEYQRQTPGSETKVGMRRRYWHLLLALALAACGTPRVTISVQSAHNATPTATVGVAATAAVGITYRASMPPEVIHLPTGPTPTFGSTSPFLVTPTAIVRTPAPYRPAAIGQSVGAWGWSYRCAGAESPSDGLVWSSAGNRLQALGSWVVVALDMRNTQANSQVVRADEFVVFDGQSRSHAPTGALGAADYSAFRGGQRFGEPVPPGATARYYLAFDVPADARDLRLVLISHPTANGFEVSFDLGR
jgi:hypothetical protein